MKKLLFAAMAVVFMATEAEAKMSLAGYYDTREQWNVTTQGSYSWENGVSIWGFVDFWTNRADSELDVDDEADQQHGKHDPCVEPVERVRRHGTESERDDPADDPETE